MYTDNIRHTDSDNSAAVSNAARTVGDDRIRVLDVDQYGYCRKCLDIIYVTEATSALTDKSTLMIRKMAMKLGAVAIFVRHEWEDANNEKAIHYAAWDHTGKQVVPLKMGSWDDYRKGMIWAQDQHDKITGCKRKAAPFHKAAFPNVWFNKKDYIAVVDDMQLV